MSRPLKVKYYILIIALVLLIPVLLGFRYYARWFSEQVYAQVASETSATLDVYLTAIKDQFRNADQFLHMGGWSVPVQTLDRDTCKEELQSMGRELLDNNNALSCVVFCSDVMDLQECYMSNTGSLPSESVECLLDIAGGENAGNVGWSLIWAGDKPFLERLLVQDDVACMVAVNMEAVGQRALSEYNMNSVVLFVKNGVPINDPYWARRYTQEDVKARSGYYLIGEGTGEYIAVTSRFLSMTAVYASRNNITDFALMSTIVYAAVIVLAFLICGIVMHYSMFVPLRKLEKVMGQIRDGDLQARPGRYVTAEFAGVNETFNQMIGSIQQLKIEKYEQEVRSARLEMDALRLQIRPHFYLNCLKNLYGLSQMKNHALLQESILYLSNHLRFTFELKRDKVTLQEELAMCENYFMLQGIGQETPPEISLSVDAILMEFIVPPVSILTLTENSFKHAGRVDAPVRMSVTAQQYAMEDATVVSIRVADNGPGFDPELLKNLNMNLDEMLEGSCTGLRNVVRRFELLYGKDFSIAFFNCEGATIELTILRRGEWDETADC